MITDHGRGRGWLLTTGALACCAVCVHLFAAGAAAAEAPNPQNVAKNRLALAGEGPALLDNADSSHHRLMRAEVPRYVPGSGPTGVEEGGAVPSALIALSRPQMATTATASFAAVRDKRRPSEALACLAGDASLAGNWRLLPDSSMTTSSHRSSGWKKAIRLNAAGHWAPKRPRKGEWVRWNFKGNKVITQLRVQGATGWWCSSCQAVHRRRSWLGRRRRVGTWRNRGWLSDLQLQYHEKGPVYWRKYDNKFGNYDPSTPVTFHLNPPIVAQEVRLVVKKWSLIPGLRADFWGCDFFDLHRLHGPPGLPGKSGVPGPPGNIGEQGKDGAQGLSGKKRQKRRRGSTRLSWTTGS